MRTQIDTPLIYRRKKLPFVFSLYPIMTVTKKIWPYGINVVDPKNLIGFEADMYLPTGRSFVVGKKPGRLIVYDKKMKQVRSEVAVFEYEYEYKHTMR